MILPCNFKGDHAQASYKVNINIYDDTQNITGTLYANKSWYSIVPIDGDIYYYGSKDIPFNLFKWILDDPSKFKDGTFIKINRIKGNDKISDVFKNIVVVKNLTMEDCPNIAFLKVGNNVLLVNEINKNVDDVVEFPIDISSSNGVFYIYFANGLPFSKIDILKFESSFSKSIYRNDPLLWLWILIPCVVVAVVAIVVIYFVVTKRKNYNTVK
jgi:hypothetical protein